jgi:hypothetical protein
LFLNHIVFPPLGVIHPPTLTKIFHQFKDIKL